jgi:sugar lactone lactonase YvrE
MNAAQSQHAHEPYGARDIMTKIFKALCTVAATVAVSACGGAGTTTVPRVAGAEAATAARVPASIVLKIPAASAASAKRRARYVSIVSRSTKIVVAAAAGCAQCSQTQTLEVQLTGQSSPCTTGPGGTTCTIALSLNPGSYAGSLIVYDGVLDAQGHVTGKTLSENTSFPIAIALGQSNAIGVVLDGVPASLTPTVLTPSTLIIGTKVVNGSATTIYRLIGNSATGQFTVTAKDADGNVIAGAGAPTYTANATNGFTASANGNTMTLNAPPAFTKQTGALTVQANSSACTDPAAVCSIAVPIGFDQIIAVADTGGGNVSVWPIGASAPSATITTGINGPYSVAFSSDGTLFVANYNNSTVTGYAPPYTGTPFTVSSHVSNPDAIAIDANNDLIVANYGGANVTIYPPPYTTTTPVTLNTGSFPAALAIDATQHLWIVSSSGALYRYPTPYVAGAFDKGIGTAPTTFNHPSGIALDSTGRLYVANSGNNNLLRFDPPYSSQAPSATIPSTVAQPMTQPANVIVGQNDVVLAGSQDGLDVYDAAGNGLGVFSVKFYKPRGEAIDQDGVVWVATGSGNGAVGLPPAYANTNQLQLLSNNYFINASAAAMYP